MGKPKKGSKNRQDEDFGDDVDVNPIVDAKDDDVDAPVSKTKKSKKAKKGRKDDDWEDDVAAEINTLSLADGDDDEDKPAKSKKKGKSAPVSAFAMLDIEESGDNEDSAGSDGEDAGKTMPKVQQKQPNDSSKNTKQKKGKKDKHKQEDEDIDALLAEIEKPVEKTGKKKKKKKGAQEEEEDEGGEAETGQNDVEAKMAEVKVMTAEDLFPDSDEDKKKKKKKGKKGKEESKDEEPAAATEVESTTAEVTVVTAEDLYPDSDEDKKKKKKKGKEESKDEAEDGEKVEGEEENDEDEGSTMKTAAQKKKEKKEREKKAKQEKAAKKTKEGPKETPKAETSESKEGSSEPVATPTTQDVQEGAEATKAGEKEGGEEGSDEEDGEKKSKKDKKKKKKEKPEKGEKKKKPANAQIKAMQEALAKMKEEEERLRIEEEEAIQREEEAARLREEKKRLDEEKKEKKKQKEKERKERLRKEGKLLTEKQKQDMKRAQQMLEMMEAQGIKVPQKDQTDEQKKKRVVYGRQRKKKSDTEVQESTPTPEEERSPSVEIQSVSEEKTAEPMEQQEAGIEEEAPAVWDDEDDVKDDWAASDDEDKGETAMETDAAPKVAKKEEKAVEPEVEEEEEEGEEEEEEDDDDDDDDDDDEDEDSEDESEEESSDDEDMTPVERARTAIMKRKEAAEKKRDLNILRAPVVCVLGHVDTGKTKILDKLRRTNVQDGEAGGITQQIGATNVPLSAIKNQTKMCKDFQKFDLKLPGLLIIDTPGHESFSNLRSRGSSLCDIAILVIDIMHGLEPQTIESINLLKSRKTPFIVALNKIDRLFGWKSDPHKDVKNVILKQQSNVKLEFDERTREVVTQLSEQGLNAALYYENKNVREYVSLVPTSAHSGDGMGSLMALICELTQTLLTKRISYIETLEATVMEVKALPGLGTTVDVILVNGSIREGDLIVVPGTEGPIVTQVRGLLMPQPMKELRVKNAYEKHKEVNAAQGVKLIAKDLEKTLAGLPMYVAHNQDEVEFYKEELAQSLKEALSSIKLTSSGVYVQASTLGSLEALLEFLRTSKIPYSGINIGPVHKKDVMKASVMLEHESQYAVILAFDVKVEREAQELADSLGVRVFTADIIYHLFDQFTKYQDDLRAKKKEEFKHVAVFPCKLRVLPNCIFNTRDPIIIGISVEAGVIKEGTPLCVPSKEFVEIGRISSMEVNHKQVDSARKGMEVCVKIENTSGDAPKLYGRHFDHTDMLVSKISRTSIDAVKDYFRDEMQKTDWGLMVELKKQFQIL